MSPRPDAPLTKVTLNLYTEDLQYLQSRDSQWSVAARILLHDAIVRQSKLNAPLPRTIGDIAND